MMLAQSHQEVSCSLGRPRPGWVGRDSGQVHPSCVVFDDEQDMEAFQEGGVDAGEVGGDYCFGLGPDEL